MQNTVWDSLPETKSFTGHMLFIEEDHLLFNVPYPPACTAPPSLSSPPNFPLRNHLIYRPHALHRGGDHLLFPNVLAHLHALIRHHWWWMQNTVWDGLSETKSFTGHMLFIEEDHLLFPNALAHLKALIHHHWWWMQNTVWDSLSETNTFTGHMLFIEEDHLLFPNALAHLTALIHVKNTRCPECVAVTLAPSNVKSRGENGLRAFVRERMGNVGYAFNRSVWEQIQKSHKLANLAALIRVKNARCPECVAVTLAPSNVLSRLESGLWAFVRERMGNVGYAFNKSVWEQIQKSHKYFCYFDDYNWDVSLC
ncbi:unnamed protein product [Closterium sp. NIES-65]|nr:unnamed protein product [Closterium sp. NIES-65]